MTPNAGRPASRHKSTAASVWPERISTPPSLAISGNTWPGCAKSAAPILPLASARTVLQRCSAEMPVVRPWWASTETVKAVPSGALFCATMGARCRRPVLQRQRRADHAAAMADDEGHFLGGAERGRDDEIALVLAVVVVGHDDDFAARDRLDGLCY